MSPFSKTIIAVTEHLIHIDSTVYLCLGTFNLFLGGLELGYCLFRRHKRRYLSIATLCVGRRCLGQSETQIVYVGEFLQVNLRLELLDERCECCG